MARVIKAGEVEILQQGSGRHAADETSGGKPHTATIWSHQIGPGQQYDAEAERLIALARIEADEIIEKAKKSAALIECEAQERGRAEGFIAGRESAVSALDELISLANAATVDWERAIRQVEEQLIELALGVASRIVGRVAEDDKNIVMASIMQALDHLAESPTVSIHVNPDDYDLVSEYWNEHRGPNYRDRSWSIVADRRISHGGCVLELETGKIDAQLPTQVHEIGRALRAAGGFSDREA